jgi:hypothetical protein
MGILEVDVKDVKETLTASCVGDTTHRFSQKIEIAFLSHMINR